MVGARSILHTSINTIHSRIYARSIFCDFIVVIIHMRARRFAAGRARYTYSSCSGSIFIIISQVHTYSYIASVIICGGSTFIRIGVFGRIIISGACRLLKGDVHAVIEEARWRSVQQGKSFLCLKLAAGYVVLCCFLLHFLIARSRRSLAFLLRHIVRGL